MSTLRLSLAQKIAFVLLDASGDVVTGLGGTYTLTISKNGGAFAPSTGAKAEISSGWYSYTLTAAETDTEGPLAMAATGTGAVQQNLLHEVVGSSWSAPAGTYILTATEASAVLRCAVDDPVMLAMLPGVDGYIKMATGRDWAADTTIREEAKNAARMLLVRWHEDPGAMAAGGSLSFGMAATLVQLEALALELESDGVPGEALAIIGSNTTAGDVAITASLVLVFNHEMAAGSTAAVTMKDGSGASVAVTNSLDATGKIMTIDPTASLSAASYYTIVLTAAADVYGLTLTTDLNFRTA